MDRRRFLVATTAFTFPVAAGCIGGDDSGGSSEGGDGDDGDDGSGGTETTTTTAAPTEGEDTTGAGGGNETTAGTADGTAAGTTVTMADTAFDPVRASVDPGTTVEWTNEDGFAHDVTSTQFHDSAAQWDMSEEVSDGGNVTYTFDSEGIYEYYCTIHGESTMCGVVLVGGSSLDETLPCEGGDEGGNETTTDGGGGGGDGGPYSY